MIGHHLLLSISGQTGCEECRLTYLSSLSFNANTAMPVDGWRAAVAVGSLNPLTPFHPDRQFYWSYWWLYEPSESTGSEPVIYRTRSFSFFTVYHHVDILGVNELLFSFTPVLELQQVSGLSHRCVDTAKEDFTSHCLVLPQLEEAGTRTLILSCRSLQCIQKHRLRFGIAASMAQQQL